MNWSEIYGRFPFRARIGIAGLAGVLFFALGYGSADGVFRLLL